MSNQVYVRDISALRDLKISLKKFSENSVTILSYIASRINQELSYLKSKEDRFLNALREAENNLRAAENSLRCCKSQGHYERDSKGNKYWVEPDCRSEETWVSGCARILRIAKDKYYRCKQIVRRVKNQISVFEAEKAKFQRFIINHNESSVSVLTQLINGVEDYKSIQPPVANTHSETSQKNMLSSTSTESATNVISNSPAYRFEAKNKQQFEISNSVDGSNISFNILQNGRSIIEKCSDCLGSGEVPCFHCYGSGKGYGPDKKCNYCKGRKTDTCPECDGTGESNGDYKTCGNLKIKEKNGRKIAQIADITFSNTYQDMGVDEHILKNMEHIARQNDCAEISGWADAHKIDFFLRQGYSVRNHIPNVGGEIYKAFSGKDGFAKTQVKIRAAFAGFNHKLLNTKEYRLEKSQLVNNIDPKKILSPEMKEKFWHHHGYCKTGYINLIKDLNKHNQLIEDGASIENITNSHPELANAYAVCTRDPIRLIKLNDYYMIDEGGNHRVAAAQLLGENVKLTAVVTEAKKTK